jgi:hypothetical protein
VEVVMHRGRRVILENCLPVSRTNAALMVALGSKDVHITLRHKGGVLTLIL